MRKKRYSKPNYKKKKIKVQMNKVDRDSYLFNNLLATAAET